MPPTAPVDAAPELTGHRAEESFVNDFAARLEAMNGDGGAADGAGSDAGSGKTGKTADAATASDAADTSTGDTADSQVDTDDAPAGDSAKDDDAGTDAPETGTESDDADEADDDSKPADADDATDDDADSDADASDDTADADAAADKSFTDTLKKNGLKASIDDLPAEARPIVEQTLANMRAAFTRTQMEATQFRKERATFAAERKFFDDHPELAVAEILSKRPDLIERVQAQLDKLEDPDKAKLFAIELKDGRQAALDAVTTESAKTERVMQRADEIETYTRRACAKLSLPFETVVNAVVIALNEKPEATRDLSPEELDKVIGQQQRILSRHTSAVRREAKKSAIQDRTRDRKTATPAVRAGGGGGTATPKPAPKAPPKNDREFVQQMIDKRGR